MPRAAAAHHGPAAQTHRRPVEGDDDRAVFADIIRRERQQPGRPRPLEMPPAPSPKGRTVPRVPRKVWMPPRCVRHTRARLPMGFGVLASSGDTAFQGEAAGIAASRTFRLGAATASRPVTGLAVRAVAAAGGARIITRSRPNPRRGPLPDVSSQAKPCWTPSPAWSGANPRGGTAARIRKTGVWEVSM